MHKTAPDEAEVADTECAFCRYTEEDDSREFPASS